MEVTPNRTTKNLIHFYVQWLDANGNQIGTPINTNVTLSRPYDWTVFYRFGSLVTNDPNASMSDGTYVIGGTFETAHLGNSNWGINSSTTPLAWIVNAPKCSVPYQWDVGEQSKIDYR